MTSKANGVCLCDTDIYLLFKVSAVVDGYLENDALPHLKPVEAVKNQHDMECIWLWIKICCNLKTCRLCKTVADAD